MPRDVRWHVLALVLLIGGPATLWVNVMEFRISAVLVGQRAPWSRSLRIAVLSAASNLLPVPGSVVVRAGALREGGSPAPASVAATGVVGLTWLGVGAVVASLGLGFADARWLAATFAAGGTVLLGAAAWISTSIHPGKGLRTWLAVVGVESAAIGITAIRLALIMSSLGVSSALRGGAALAVSGAIASAIGVVPGGLGVRETVAALIGTAVGVTPSIGFLASAIDRIVDLAWYAPLALALLVGARSRTRTASTERDPS